MLQTSKLTGKYQATVPTSIRKALNLSAGDLIGFEIIGSEVRLTRATPLDVAFTQALESTLEEWSSKEDDVAFQDL
jgi:antitoxin PrlF